MIRRCLTRGVPLTLAAVLLFFIPSISWETRTALFAFIAVAVSIEIAHGTTQATATYGARGMPVEMAAMMAAMGTGLSIGYALGMVWHLGWANLVGVLAGLTHGLMMGRRYGPMAALEGAGGGVMGGLMGPMLAVMLLYLPTSLILTAVLMLMLQAAFSLGGVYLAAAAVGKVPASGWLHRVGHVLGSQYQEVACCVVEVPAPATRARASRPRHHRPEGRVVRRRSWLAAPIVVVAVAVSFMALVGGAGSSVFGTTSPAGRSDAFGGQLAEQAVAATIDADGVQQLGLGLRYPRYEPKLLEAKAGVPLRLTLEAIGEPG